MAKYNRRDALRAAGRKFPDRHEGATNEKLGYKKHVIQDERCLVSVCESTGRVSPIVGRDRSVENVSYQVTNKTRARGFDLVVHDAAQFQREKHARADMRHERVEIGEKSVRVGGGARGEVRESYKGSTALVSPGKQ